MLWTLAKVVQTCNLTTEFAALRASESGT